MPNPDEQSFRSAPAARLEPGITILTPDGASVTLREVEWEADDYGHPAVAILTHDGGTLRLAGSATVSVVGEGTDPASAGTPEAVTAAAAAAHGGHEAVQRLAAHLAKGLNVKSGAQLQEVSKLVRILFVQLGDSTHAMSVSNLIAHLPYDGNPGRWTPVEQVLAITHYLARTNGGKAEAERLANLLRAPDTAESDPLRAKLNAQLRQRSLNEPNLYDKEISKAASAGERSVELDWRELRLQSLLHLLAHGGSETYDDAELLRRISNELNELRNPNAG